MYSYLVLVGWLYVALMASVAEAANPGGTVLGAIITFVFYGLVPVSILGYILLTPVRKRAQRAREAMNAARPQPIDSPVAPDTGSHAPTDAVPPVGKEP